jgi:hypothetical protein
MQGPLAGLSGPSSARSSSRPASRAAQTWAPRGGRTGQARIVPLIRDLVSQVSGYAGEDSEHESRVNSILRIIDSGKYSSPVLDHKQTEKRIKGYEFIFA